MAGRQMAMAMAQMQNERQRIELERQRVSEEKRHQLITEKELHTLHAATIAAQIREQERMEKGQQFTQESQARGDIQKGLYGTAPGQPGIDTSSPESIGASLANAPTSLAPTAPMELPAMPGVPAQQIPTATQSPADLTTGVAQTSPTTSSAIAGTPGISVQQTPGQDINAGGVIIPAAQARAIPIKPPLGEAEKLGLEHENAMQLEGKRQEQEQRQLEATKIYHTQEIAVQNRAADLALQNLKETMGLRRDMFGVKIADDAGKIAEKVIAGPVFQKQLNNYGPLMDYMKDLTAKDANGRAGNTSGIADAEAMNRLNVMVAGTPLASMARVKDFADSLKTTPENLGNKIRQLTNKNNVLLSPDQKKQLGLAIHQAFINVHQDYVMRFNAGAQQMKQIHFGEDPATITKYSGILW